MEAYRRLWRGIPPLGMLSLAAFAICTASGIMLVPVFVPSAPLDSLALLSLKNPTGLFIRSLHFWSAQAFFVLTVAHIADHLVRRSERAIRFGIWARLSLSIPVVVAAMLSGFLLRADSAATQAVPVLRTLLRAIPFLGAALRNLLTGTGADLSTVYIHHACTATLIIWLVTIEHSRLIMPSAQSLMWIMPPVVLFSLLLVPGLEWRASGAEKGPWYLVGLQELLHWLPRPQVAVWGGIAGLSLLVLLPTLPSQFQTSTRWTLATATLLYAALTLIGVGFRGDGWRWMTPIKALKGQNGFVSLRAYISPNSELLRSNVQIVDGRREGCLSCHQGMSGFVAAHDPKAIGCVSCHLGNPWTLNKQLAHAGMTLTPGNLSVVDQTCGASNCHTDQADRVRHSLMNTMSGVIAVDKYAFGESQNLNAYFTVAELGHSPADTHLRSLCASCHLGQDKQHPGPINEVDRGGGCSACHLSYGPAAKVELQNAATRQDAPAHHPDISIHIPNEACFGCHSRSGRISTSYEGWHETLLDENAARVSPGWPGRFRLVADGRVFEKHAADTHAEKGMTCVDCHLASEVMGDGSSHVHENDAVRIACADCHAPGKSNTRSHAELDTETQQIVAMRRLNEPGRAFVTPGQRGSAYPNVFRDSNGDVVVATENSENLLRARPMTKECAGDTHSRLTCSACHTAWASQCISCHTSFDRMVQGWDHVAGTYVDGVWNEQAAGYLSDAPTLGVEGAIGSDGRVEERVTTFIPGMILNLDLGANSRADQARFNRLFAPASAHTTASPARDCRSCHSSAAALGYGRGRLDYVVAGHSGKWEFTPAYTTRVEDGLPADAWTGFLREPRADAATRVGARPFSLDEQRKILLVGACLSCHSEKDKRVASAFADFENYRSKIGPKCVLPDFVPGEPKQ